MGAEQTVRRRLQRPPPLHPPVNATPSQTPATAVVLVALLVAAHACVAAPERREPPPGPSAASAAARRSRPPGTAISSHPALTGTVLPSGLRLLLEEDPYAMTAGVVAVLSGGSATDPPGCEGLVHLVEHLSFRAIDAPRSGERPMTRSDRLVKYATGDSNGFTSNDWVMFYEFGPASSLPMLVELEGARLADPLVGVDQSVFELERQVIGSEHLLRTDPRAGNWASSTVFPTLFAATHPYSRPLGGTDDSRKRLTLQQARTYAAQHFVPEKMTVMVSAPPGTTSLNDIIDRLPARLQGDPAHRRDRPSPSAPTGAATATAPVPANAPAPATNTNAAPEGAALRVQRKHSPLPTPELWLGWVLPGAYGEAGPTIEILQRWVQQDLDLGQLSQEDSHIRYLAATVQPGTAGSVLFVRVLVSDGASAERVAQVVASRISSIWAREPMEREFFAGFRSLYETEQLLDKPAQVGRALQETVECAMTETVRPMSQMLGSIQAVTSGAAAQFAYHHLTQARARAVMFTPVNTSSLPEESRLPVPGSTLAGDKTVSELVPGAGGWDGAGLGALLPAASQVVVKELPTGLTVVTVRRPSASVVAWLGFRGGYADADPPLLVELAMRARPDAVQAPKLHILPGRGASRDLSFDMVEFQPSQLVNGLTLLFAKASSAVKDWPARDGLERLLAPVAASEDGKSIQAARAFWRALLGDRPPARVVATDDLDKLTHSDVDAWLGRVHHVRNAALIVIGDADPAEVERGAAILSRQLHSPSWVPQLPAPAPPPLQAGKGDHIVPVITGRAGTLAEIRLGCLLPTLTEADRGSYEVLRYAMESRLNGALRVDHGDGYGVSVGYERLRGGTTYLVASTFIPDQSLARSLGTLHDHWRRWSSSGFDPTELNVGRWRYVSALPATYANPHALAYQLLDEWNAEPTGLLREHLHPEVPALPLGRVNELFAACKSNAVLAVTGNEAAIRRALNQAWPEMNGRARPSAH